jgi:hypothetical protein
MNIDAGHCFEGARVGSETSRPHIDRARTSGTDAVKAAVIHFRIKETNGVAATIDAEAPPVASMTRD